MKIKPYYSQEITKKKFDVDLCIKAPAYRVDRIQELHITILYLICELTEQKYNLLNEKTALITVFRSRWSYLGNFY